MKKNPYGTVIWLGVIMLVISAIFYLSRPSFYAQCNSYLDAETGMTFTSCCTNTPDHQSCINMPGTMGQHLTAIAFSRTGKRAAKVLGEVDACHLVQMKDETKIDFIFMFFYTAFLLVFIYTTSRFMRRDPIMLIGFLPLVAFAADIVENLYMLEMLDLFLSNSTAGLDQIAYKLYIFTLVKWFALAFTFLFIGTVLVKGNPWYKLVTFLLLVPLGLGIGHFFYAPLEFWFFLSSFAAFIWLFLVAVLFRGHKSSRGIYV